MKTRYRGEYKIVKRCYKTSRLGGTEYEVYRMGSDECLGYFFRLRDAEAWVHGLING